jgi:type I restriction enzyme M protein
VAAQDREDTESAGTGCHPKAVISKLAEELLAHYTWKTADRPLRCLSAPAGLLGGDDAGRLLPDRRRRLEGRNLPRHREDKKGKEKDKGWTCDLVPKPLIVARYFAKEQAAIDQIAAELETATAKLAELEEEHGGDEGAFSELEKVNKAEITKRLKEIKGDKDARTKPPY